jgi:hypothetical protein
MEINVSGEFSDSTLIYEENLFGGIGNWDFWGFSSGFHVGLLRRGDTYVFLCALGNLFSRLELVL